MADLIKPQPGLPGCRHVHGLTVLTLRHFWGDSSAAQAVQALHLPWPNAAGQLLGQDPWLAWCSPQETLLLATQAQPARSLLASLAPGRSTTAMAADVSSALHTLELHGPRLDDWLSRLVDTSAIPREAGRCTRGRFADAAALMLRLGPDRLWLLVDAPQAAYFENWLSYTHQTAFDTHP